jgi:hypothetical protein
MRKFVFPIKGRKLIQFENKEPVRIYRHKREEIKGGERTPSGGYS